MTRILFLGDSAHTGFGTVTWDLGKELLALGEDVRFISTNQTADPIPEPLGSRTWDPEKGVDIPGIIRGGFRDGWKPEAAILLGDYGLVEHVVLRTAPALTQAFASIPTFHYVPIEGIDLPPKWMDLWTVVVPVAMTKFGADEIEKIAGYRPPMVYHGVNTEDFYPVSATHPGSWNGKPVHSKAVAKGMLNYPMDRIMVLRTDRHMPRKMYNRFIRIMSRVFDQTENVDLVIHCRETDHGGHLFDTISKLPLEHRHRIKFTNAHDTWTGLPRPELNVLINAADVVAMIGAEGFGLTGAEAIAAGVPVVALDYAAATEVIGEAGVLIPPAFLVDNEYDYFWAAIDEEKAAAAIVTLAKDARLRQRLGRKGPEHAATFSWASAAKQFSDLIGATVNQPVLTVMQGGEGAA